MDSKVLGNTWSETLPLHNVLEMHSGNCGNIIQKVTDCTHEWGSMCTAKTMIWRSIWKQHSLKDFLKKIMFSASTGGILYFLLTKQMQANLSVTQVVSFMQMRFARTLFTVFAHDHNAMCAVTPVVIRWFANVDSVGYPPIPQPSLLFKDEDWWIESMVTKVIMISLSRKFMTQI